MALLTAQLVNETAAADFATDWIANDAQIFKHAKAGVETGLFYAFAETIKMDNKSLASILHLSARTVSNYHQNNQALDPVQSEHLLKLIALYDKGSEVFGSIDEFNYWLNKPFWNADEKCCFDVVGDGVQAIHRPAGRHGAACYRSTYPCGAYRRRYRQQGARVVAAGIAD